MKPRKTQPPRTGCWEAACDLRAVRQACRAARAFLAESGLPLRQLDAWELAIAEASNNAVQHTPPERRTLPIRIVASVAPNLVEVRITDHGEGFELPAQAALPEPGAETGRGLFLIQNLTDEVRYDRGPQENCLVLRKGVSQ